MLKIGIVGHRFFNDPSILKFVSDECDQVLAVLESQAEHLTVLSALAEGADTIFAQAAVARGMQLHIVRPFDSYRNDFITEVANSNYERLCRAAARETFLTYHSRSVEAYRDAMLWVVNNSDILVAVWNGQASLGIGGTADAVNYAKAGHKNWIHINVIDRKTVFHFSRTFPHLNSNKSYATS